jgi:hypothetical protein
MTPTRWLATVAALLSLASSAAAAESSPLAQVPADAPLVISLHGVKRTTDRLVTMVKNAVPDLGAEVQAKLGDAFQTGFFEGRKLQGLPDDGWVFLVMTRLPRPDDEEAPAIAVIAQVTSYKAFQGSLMTPDELKTLKRDAQAGCEVAQVRGRDLYFLDRKGYALVSANRKVAAALARRSMGQGLSGKLAPEIRQRLLAADLAVYVDLPTVARTYAKNLKAIQQDYINPFLDRGPQTGLISKDRADTVRILTQAALQVMADGRSALLTVAFQPDGAALHLELHVGTDTKTNLFLKDMKPAPLASVKSLPGSYSNFTAVEYGPHGFKWLHPITRGALHISAGGDDDENSDAREAIIAAVGQFVAARPLRAFTASNFTGLEELRIWEFADPARGAAAQLQLFRALKKGSEYQLYPLREMPVIKAKSQPYRGTRLHFVSMKWDFEKMRDNALGSQEIVDTLRKTIGEGVKVWFGVVDRIYVQISAPNWPSAARRLDAFLDKKGAIGTTNKAFLQSRDHLPARASNLGFQEADALARMLGTFLAQAAEGLGKKVKPPPPPSGQTPSSFVATAFALQAGQANLDLWFPGAAVGDFRRVLEPMIRSLSAK